jgi:hypothetical protein
MNIKRLSFAAALLTLALPAHAKPVDVPLQIDYDFIRNILVSELYTGPGNTAKVWEDKCGYVTLSDPKLDGQKGLVHGVNKLQTRLGAKLGGKCITLLDWEGFLETFQKPTLDAAKSLVTLPVVNMSAYDASGKPLATGKLWETVRRFVEPKLSGVKLDLHDAKEKIQKTLPSLVPDENAAEIRRAVDSLTLNKIAAGDKGVDLAFGFDMPELKPVKAVERQSSAPLSAEEMQQWQDSWEHWEAFLNDAVNQATQDTQSQALRGDLQEVLADAHNAFEEGLSAPAQDGNDPVRSFFTRSWPRLAPALKEVSKELPGAESLRYVTFIAATDVLYELDNQGALLGLDISSDGLRKLARLMIAEKAEK